MKMKKITLGMLMLGAITIGITSCEKDDVEKQDTKIVATDSISMPFSTDHYVFYSLKDGKEIPLADSASTKWDIGIRFASIIVNNEASGPGKGGVIVKTGNYDSFNTLPETGYAYDTSATRLAVDGNPRSPNAWYLYSSAGHTLTPKAGLFFLIKTAEGKYAKMEVMEVNYAGYDPTVDMYPDTIVYKFRYTYQPDGSPVLSE